MHSPHTVMEIQGAVDDAQGTGKERSPKPQAVEYQCDA